MSEQETKNETLIDRLFGVGAHFAFTRSRRHPSAAPFIFGAKGGVEIFDLEKTKTQLEDALAFIAEKAKNGEQLLFVGSKREAQDAVRRAALELAMPYVTGRWIGGTLTNFSEIKKRINRLTQLQSEREAGELSKYTKKERLLIDREIETLEDMFGGIVPMEQMPAALVIIDTKSEQIAVDEAHTKGIPIVALMGSDCNVNDVDYPVVANDASKHTITFFMEEVAKAYREHKRAPLIAGDEPQAEQDGAKTETPSS